LGFLEIGKLIKDVSAYANTSRQLLKLEVEVRKKQIAPLIIAAFLGLLFVIFFFVSLTFLIGGLFKYLGFETLISLGLSFLSVSGLFLIILLLILAITKAKSKKQSIKKSHDPSLLDT
jgi:protein-S-isoprenylcysteine O-methyltransferase Ste14